MFNTFYHMKNYQREVWCMINKFDSFDIKSILYTKNSDTIMLNDQAFDLNLDDDSTDMKFDLETCRPLIPCTNWRHLNDD